MNKKPGSDMMREAYIFLRSAAENALTPEQATAHAAIATAYIMAAQTEILQAILEKLNFEDSP